MIPFDLLPILGLIGLFIAIGIYTWVGTGKEHDRAIRRQEDECRKANDKSRRRNKSR